MPNLIKQLKWFLVDQFMFNVSGGGGGGGGPAPVTQNVSNTNIPEYARPYVEQTLGQAAALTDINQNPYQTYGGQRIAGFSPLQEQAFANVASQTTASQLTPATQFATQSGQGSLSTAGQMAGAGDRYSQMATDPRAMQSYMNPYVQASLQPQLNMIAQQAGIQGAAQQGAATQAGAFGGSRSALANNLTKQNALMAQQAAIGQGYNQAFQQAQQAQQFGANLGLQGLQGALSGYGQAGQAAATLGQLGQTQFGQQQAINQAQQTTGAVQQAQAQQALDQQYQDFLKQKNYPYQQLAFMSDMLRGLPLSQAAQTQYTAPPSAASQLGGLGMSALGIYGMSGGFKAKGGIVGKGYAKGGMAYATGGDIAMLSTEQLQQLLDNPQLSPMELAMVEKQLMLRRRMEMNPESDEIMSPATGRAGIAAIGTGEMVPEEGMAGGGIVAFAEGGKPAALTSYQDMLRASVAKKLQGLEDNTVDPFAESKATEAKIREQLADIKRTSPFEALAMTGLGTMAGTSQYGLTNLGLGGIEGLKSYAKSKGEADQLNKLLLQQGVEREKSKYARDMGTLNAQLAELGRMDTKEIGLKQVAATAGATAEARNERLRLQAAALWKDTTHDIATELKDQAKFNSIYRKDPVAFQALVEQEAKKRMDPKTLELIGKTPYKAPATPAAAPGAAPKVYPTPSNQAISALKSRKDVDVAKAQFDAIFGPGAAQQVLGK